MKRLLTAALIALSLATSGVLPAQAALTQAGSMSPIVATFDQKTVTLVPPISNSPGAWTFTAANPAVATISGNIATLIGAGYTRITAVQAAASGYNSVSRVTELTVKKGTPVITAIPNQSVPFASKSFTIPTPTSPSDGAWSYSINGSPFASLSRNVITFNDGGNIYVTATQTATPAWNGTTLNFVLTVQLIPPTLGTFGDITINRDSVTSITLSPPSSNSTGVWTFSSNNTAIATVSGTTLTPVSIGSTTITATQAKATPYASATITMNVTITGTAPAVSPWSSITSTYAANKTIVLTPPTSNSPGTWSYTSSDPATASIAGAVVTFNKPGIVTLTANQAASGSYSPVGPITTTLTIQGTPTLTPMVNLLRVAGDPDIALIAPTSASPGAVTFASSDPNVVAINGSSAKIVGAGTATITANQAASTYWLPTSTSFTIQVNGIVPTLGAFNAITINADNKAIVIVPPTSNSKGTWTFTSSDSSVAKVLANTIIGVKVGTATITAVQNPGGLFGQSNMVTTTVTVNPAPTPSPTPTPVATPTPKPTPSAKPTPVATPTVAPVAPVKIALIKVTIAKRIVTVTSTVKSVVVTIDGKKSSLGRHTLKPGKHVYLVMQGRTIVYSKTLTIK